MTSLPPTLKLHVERNIRRQRVELFGFLRGSDGKRYRLSDLMLFDPTPHQPGVEAEPASLPFGMEDPDSALQQIVDAAWEAGIRPKQTQDQATALRFQGAHLEDMRRIAGLTKDPS